MVDEHWCSDCKAPLDKTKDQYVEAEFPNQKEPGRTNRVFLCRKCATKSTVTVGGQNMTVWSLMRKLRHRGNPTFEIGIHCYAASVCGTYSPTKGRVNCAHVAVTPEGHVYCKRNHPGFVVLAQEKAIVERSRFRSILEYVKRMGRTVGMGRLSTILKAYGFSPANARTATEIGPVGKDVTATAARAAKGK